MDSTSIFTQQIPIGLVLIFVQNYLKQKKWFPWVDYNSPRWNHLFSIASTGLVTLGIHFTWSSTDHTLLVSGLAAPAIFQGAWHWLQQYIITKTGYTALAGQLNPPAAQQPTAVIDTSEIKSPEAPVKSSDSPYSIK